MRHLILILLVLLTAWSTSRAATVTGSVADATGTLITNAVVKFQPLSTPQVEGGIILLSSTKNVTATNGTFEVVLEQGDYRVSISGRDQFMISVPNDTTTNSIDALVTSSLTYVYTAPPLYAYFTNGVWQMTQGGTGATNAAGARAALELGEWTTNSAVPVAGGAFTNLTTLPIPLLQGGTEATNAAGARASLGIAEWTTNSAVPAPSGPFTNITAVPIPVAEGGTGASDAAGARTALGLGSMATVDSPVPVANGGTAATDTGNARLNLGLGSVATEDVVPVAKGGTGVGATGSWVPTFLGAADTGTARAALGIVATNVSGYNSTQFDTGSTTNLQIKAGAATTNMNLVGTYPFIPGHLITPSWTLQYADFSSGITGFSAYNGASVSWDSTVKALRYSSTDSGDRGLNSTAWLTSGRIYRMSLTIKSNEVGSAGMFAIAGWFNPIPGVTNLGLGTHSYVFKAPASWWLMLLTTDPATNYIDDFHCYEISGSTREIAALNDLSRSNYVMGLRSGSYTNYSFGLSGVGSGVPSGVLIPEDTLTCGIPYVWNDGSVDSSGILPFTPIGGVAVVRDTTNMSFLVTRAMQVGSSHLIPTGRDYRLSWSQTNINGGGFVAYARYAVPISTNTADGTHSIVFTQSASSGYGTSPLLMCVNGAGTSNWLDNVSLQEITPSTNRLYAMGTELLSSSNTLSSAIHALEPMCTNEVVIMDDDFDASPLKWNELWGSPNFVNDTASGCLTFWNSAGSSGFVRTVTDLIPGERYAICALVTNIVASNPIVLARAWASTPQRRTTDGWNYLPFEATNTFEFVAFWTLNPGTNTIYRYAIMRMPNNRGFAHRGDVFLAAEGITNQLSVVIGSEASVNSSSQVAIGRGAEASIANGIAIGYQASAKWDSGGTLYGGSTSDGPECTAVGESAKAVAWRATAVGAKAIAASTSSTAYGNGALAQKVHGVAIGRGAAIFANTPNATIVIGSTDPTHELYLGNSWGNYISEHPLYGGGFINSTNNPPSNYSRLNGPSGFDTRSTPLLINCPGGPIKIAGGRSTGSGTGGEIHFETSPATGAAGTNTQNALVIAGKFDATTTTNSGSYCATRFLLLDTVSGTTKRVYLHPTPDSGGTGFRMLVTPN